nr:PH domain-containing protein [Arcanobacterium pluranimalium]
MSYAIVPSGIHYRKGIFIKQHKHIPWNRIQSVEVEQRLFGRIFGFGSVKVDSAGMQSENMDLGLLRLAECSSLRKEILFSLNSARTGTPVATQTAPLATPDSPAMTAPQGTIPAQGSVDAAGTALANDFNAVPILDADDDERDILVYRLGTAQMLMANIFDTQLLMLVFFTLLPLVITIIAGDVQIIAILFPILAVGWTILKSLFDDYGTKIYLSENGLRRRAGLTKVITRTIPPQRVHAIGISQPLLWRRFDWWKLDLTTADKDLKELKQLSQSFILAGTRDEILRILWTLTPSLGSDDDRALLAEALDGQGSGKYFVGAPRSARLLDPISLPGRGVFASTRTLIIRSGRWARKISVVLQDHTQSTMATVGPIQRRKNLASLNVHTVLGNVNTKLKNFDQDYVEHLLIAETELARQARSIGVSESLQEWKTRIGLDR